MAKRESFYLPATELRATTGADGSRTLAGTIPYNSPSAGLPWTETIAPGAFADALKGSVLCLRDHKPELLLGNTDAKTLVLSDTPNGLQFRCLLPKTSTAEDLVQSLSRGDISGASFGFVVNPGGDEWKDNGKGQLTRTLKSVSLSEISVCSFAAYPDASASLRSVPPALRSLLKRSREDGCDCDCPECEDGDCDDCSDEDCDDAQCAENGCPNQGSDEERSWAANMLLRIEVAKRQ